MLERWYREGMDGDTPEMPAPGYKWRNLDKLNMQIWQQYQDVKISTAIKRITLSHQRIMRLIEAHHDEEIFTKKYYKWTKTSNLYSYFAANTTDPGRARESSSTRRTGITGAKTSNNIWWQGANRAGSPERAGKRVRSASPGNGAGYSA